MVLAWPAARNLEYEYALITSWLVIFSCSVIGALAPPQSFSSGRRQMALKDFLLLLVVPLLTLIPGGLLFLTQQCPCSGMGYFFWMTLLVLPASWVGLAIMLWSFRFREGNFRVLGWLTATLPLMLMIFAAALLWFMPQKRVTSIVLGFLHGPIYDRWIPLDAGIAWMRVAHGLIGIALMALAGNLLRLGHWMLRVSLLVALMILLVAQTESSQGHGFGALDRELPETLTMTDVKIHYLRRNPRDEEVARQLLRDAAFHVAELKELLSVQLPVPIEIYAYTNSEQKKILFGGGHTDVTDVWTPSIHVELDASPHPTLRHELVHAVSSYASWHGIGFHPNMVLTEGLAMALAPTEQSLTFDQIAAGLIKSRRLQSVDGLLSPMGFWKEAGSRSYVVAGSLLRWLKDHYGADAVRVIYSGTSMADATGQSESTIIEAWKRDILLGHQAADDLMVESITREPSVLDDLCPHTTEDLARPLSSEWLVRLRQPLGWNPGKWDAWRADLNPDDRQARLNLARSEIDLLMKAKDLNIQVLRVWIDTLAQSTARPPKVIEDIESVILQSDMLSVLGERDVSNKMVSELGHVFKSKNPGSGIRRQIEARQAIEDFLAPEKSLAWRRYLAGWSALPRVDQNSSWIEHYLAARRANQASLEQIEQWRSMLPRALDFPYIHREWTRLLAAGYTRLNQYETASELYDQLVMLSTGESKSLASEHARRVRYLSRL
jgi:hypothetical protein